MAPWALASWAASISDAWLPGGEQGIFGVEEAGDRGVEVGLGGGYLGAGGGASGL
jgi:hypothetical protein